MRVSFSPGVLAKLYLSDIKNFQHTLTCQALTSDRNAQIQAWDEKWPDHCERCLGSGGFLGRYDPSPPGVGLSPGWFYEWDPCPDCVEKSVCPRCSASIGDDPDVPCSKCGWLENSKEPERPRPVECGCWEEFSYWRDWLFDWVDAHKSELRFRSF